MAFYITPNKRRLVHKRDKFTCQKCGVKAPISDKINKDYDGSFAPYLPDREDGKLWILEIDHVEAQSIGGGNHISNLQTLCNICNSKKSNK